MANGSKEGRGLGRHPAGKDKWEDPKARGHGEFEN